MSVGFLLVVFIFLNNYVNGGLNELCLQMDYYSGAGLFHCLLYDEYGCWCGPGGSGPPVDGSDSCCRAHDHCYDKIIAEKKCNPYVDQYKFKEGECLDDVESCLHNICLCDQDIAKCLSKNVYHPKYYGWRLWHTCK